MALSMDEQRMLAEIERRLAAEDPGLAARLSSFKRSGPGGRLRSPRGRVVGSLSAVALAVVISVMVYAMIPFRAHSPAGGVSPQATGNVSASSPAKVTPKTAAAGTTGSASTAKTGASSKPATARQAAGTTTAKTSDAKTAGATVGRAP
jgi:hypothetical protein